MEAADVDWRTRERARFAAGILTSSLAPTNTLPGNPAALKRAIETGGGSLVAGARHFVDDLRHNGGMPKQVDSSKFTVGENLAVTPGAVVYRNEVFELLQYQPTTPTVRARPVLLIPPPINKYYFLDLAPGPELHRARRRPGPPVLRDLVAQPSEGARRLGPRHLRAGGARRHRRHL